MKTLFLKTVQNNMLTYLGLLAVAMGDKQHGLPYASERDQFIVEIAPFLYL